jgi:hypothetical protein
MIKKTAFLIFLIMLLTVCTTDPVYEPSPRINPDSWKEAFSGEEILIITQGTVAVDLVDLLQKEIPEARWTIRFDYNPDVSSNYLVLNYTQEKSGTPLGSIVTQMFTSIPFDDILQVNSNRVRLAYFPEDTFEGWDNDLQSHLKAYAGLIKTTTIEKTRGSWYTDPLSAYIKTSVDSQTGDHFLTVVNYRTGEERQILRYEITREKGQSEISWTVKFYDLCGEVEWISGMVTTDDREGETLSGFYGAMEEGELIYTGKSSRSRSNGERSLGQVDVEFGNGQTLSWVGGLSLRSAVPNDSGKISITHGEDGFLVNGYDFSGNSFPLFLLAVDYDKNRVSVKTYMRIRSLELPLLFNGDDAEKGVPRSYSFENLRMNFTENLILPVRNIDSVQIASVGQDQGFLDLYDGRFYSLVDPEVPGEVPERNTLLLFSNRLPFGSLDFIPQLVSFYPELDILDVESDLIFSDEGSSDYFIRLKTSPMEPGTIYQVSVRAHPTLFDQDYLWEFKAPTHK